jgi:putative endopeptidase
MKIELGGLCALVLAASAAVASAADQPAPSYGAWGYDLSGRDASVSPGDDFFRYANGAYQDRLVVPADRPGYSLRLASTEQTERDLRAILEQAAAKAAAVPKDDAGKVGAFYASFMDEARIDRIGAVPMSADLAAIARAGDRSAIAALMGATNKSFQGSIFAVDIYPDAKDPDRYVTYLGQAGLGLPDRDYYLDDKFAAKKAAYRRYVATLLTLLGDRDAQAHADDIVAFETKVAKASWTKAEQRDQDAIYNPMKVRDLDAFAPGFDWHAFLGAADLGGVDRVILVEKSALPKMAKIFAGTPLGTLRAYQTFHLADNAAPYLSRRFADARFEMMNRTLSGQAEQPARWKRGVRAVSGGDYLAGDRLDRFGNMGWAVGRIYVARHFPARSKARVEAMVDDLEAAFRVRLESLDWMGPDTKVEALKKLAAYRVKIGYPDSWRDYSALTIRRDDLYGNVVRTAAHDWAFRTGRINARVDRDEWIMTPQTNDAYNGSFNDIVFPAGILTPPIFNPDADAAINYGAVGGVIGHELTHGFDDQGRKYDATGALRDWWTKDDARVFEARAAMLGKQYAAYEPLPGARVNPQLTMGENIADLGGLTMALDAYRASLKGKPAPVIDGLTGEQRVFIGWAQAWRGKLRDDALRRQVVSDPHSPRPYRVNGPARNIDAWYQAFGVHDGEALYLKPEDRVRIW